MKYLVIRETKGTFNQLVDEFESKKEAVEFAVDTWETICSADKKNMIDFYVLESINPDEDSENHYDGSILVAFVFNGKHIEEEAYAKAEFELEIEDARELYYENDNGQVELSIKLQEIVEKYNELYQQFAPF